MPTIKQKKLKLCKLKHQKKVRASIEAKTQGNKLSQTDTLALDDLVKEKEAAQNKKREVDRVYYKRTYCANVEDKKASSK